MHRWGPYASGSRTLRYIGTGRSQGSTAVQFAYVRVKVSTLREVRAFLQPRTCIYIYNLYAHAVKQYLYQPMAKSLGVGPTKLLGVVWSPESPLIGGLA